MNYLIFFICFLIIPLQLTFAQVKVDLWYNSNWEITTKDRATYHRVAEYDPNYLDLNGKVVDTNVEGRQVMTGSFINGRKSGEFIMVTGGNDLGFLYRTNIKQGSNFTNLSDYTNIGNGIGIFSSRIVTRVLNLTLSNVTLDLLARISIWWTSGWIDIEKGKTFTKNLLFQ